VEVEQYDPENVDDRAKKVREKICYGVERATHLTGSYPPSEKGWQRSNRRAPMKAPLSSPYLSIAWSMYREQLGVNLQEGGSMGEINRR
jgi:hypothetical protein